MSAGRILVVDDERDMAESCAFLLNRAGFSASTAFSADAALSLLDREPFSLVITDLRMPRASGLELLEQVKRRDEDVEVVIVTGYPEIESAVEAIQKGALDYLTKPYDETALMDRVEKAFAHRRVKEQNTQLKERLRKGVRGRELVYRSPLFAQMVETLERVAHSDATVLLQGESGTGKELLAHRLHDCSPRAGRPFVPVDCATVPENLVESELFGHVKGAFSGADSSRAGLFAVADGGTLFLDEVGELPVTFQPKLLRTIQERQIRRVGGERYRDIDVRIVCATNRNLAEMVQRGEFREDLFYRLDVIRLEVPPLRDRLEDVEPMAERFLEDFRSQGRSDLAGFAPAALAAMRAFPWPGNGRQLRNVVERACALATGPQIRVEDLPGHLTSATGDAVLTDADTAVSFQEMKARKVAAIESAYLEKLLNKHRGNVTRSAEEAGMARSALQKLMQRYGIKSSEYRD